MVDLIGQYMRQFGTEPLVSARSGVTRRRHIRNDFAIHYTKLQWSGWNFG
jgi:hypothetical protein